MIELQDTITNPIFAPESEYCRGFLRKQYFAPERPEWFSVGPDISRTRSAIHIEKAENRYYEVEVQLERTLCASIAGEGSELMGLMSYKDFTLNLLNVGTSKGYSVARTTPVINKLSKMWVDFVTHLTWLPIDIDQVHRSLMFDITSSDPVEDFLRIEPFAEIAEIQLTIPYVSDPMPKFKKIISSTSAQKNISFDRAPKAVTLDFEEEE